jgi:type IX secretion system PorP/SprF family membrane protein
MKRPFLQILFITGLMFLLIKQGKTQDIHFSQFWASPLSLNPSNTGNHAGDWRLSNNFRTQWRAVGIPYNTISVGFDMPFYIHSEKFSWGIYLVNDKSGNASLMVNKIFVSGAWHKPIGDNNLHLGIQAGYVLKNFSMDKITFPDQFDMNTGQFNSELQNNENNLTTGLSYFDLNIGAGWSRKFGKISPEAAIAFFHLTSPRETFLTDNNRLPMRSVVNIGSDIGIGKKFFLYPRVLFMGHTHSSDFLAGLSAGLRFEKNPLGIKTIHAGPYLRNGVASNMDAVIGEVGLSIKNFDIGVSYDWNISKLVYATNHRGALELSLIYTTATTIPSKITIPCERY